MAHTRVHDLAREWRTESSFVIKKLMELGVFVKSASSVVARFDEYTLRQAVLKAEAEGVDVQNWFSAAGGKPPWRNLDERVKWERNRAGARNLFDHKPRPMKTSWTGSSLAGVAEQKWRKHGLGDDNEPLARWLAEHGFWPEDLDILLRGTPARTRFRSGEASWVVVASELREVKNSVPTEKRVPPSTAVIRRSKSALHLPATSDWHGR